MPDESRLDTSDSMTLPPSDVAVPADGGSRPASAVPSRCGDGSPTAAYSLASGNDPWATCLTERSPGVAAGTSPVAVAGYEILGELGRGGMGVVYRARQQGLNRLVALKMILTGGHAGAQDRARFHAEAQAVARLKHPGIVQVYEVGEHEGLPFFSLELCEGGSLAARLATTPLPSVEAARLTEKLAQAVQAAHQAQVIHRDLKPANVLLTADGTPKITDFGLARKLDEVGQTASGAVMGTPSYMAPEQAMGKNRDVGPATDVYALGALLYECLTGRPPFQAATALDTILQVVAEDPLPPRQLRTDIPRDLEMVCLKCLEKDPHRRYADAAALAADLNRFLEGEPVSVMQSGMVDRMVGSLDRVRLQERFAQYATMLLWLAPVMLLTDAVITLVVLRGWPTLLLPVVECGRMVLFLLLLGHARGWRWSPQGATERHLWAVWGGYFLACLILGLTNGIVFGTSDPLRELRNYPAWAILTALAYFSLTANFWGYYMVIGLGFLGLSLVMAADLRWAGLEFGAAYAVLLIFFGLRLRRLGQHSTEHEALK